MQRVLSPRFGRKASAGDVLYPSLRWAKVEVETGLGPPEIALGAKLCTLLSSPLWTYDFAVERDVVEQSRRRDSEACLATAQRAAALAIRAAKQALMESRRSEYSAEVTETVDPQSCRAAARDRVGAPLVLYEKSSVEARPLVTGIAVDLATPKPSPPSYESAVAERELDPPVSSRVVASLPPPYESVW